MCGWEDSGVDGRWGADGFFQQNEYYFTSEENNIFHKSKAKFENLTT